MTRIRYNGAGCIIATRFFICPNFNLVGKCSLTTYLADKCKKPQVDALFRREKFVANAESAVDKSFS